MQQNHYENFDLVLLRYNSEVVQVAYYSDGYTSNRKVELTFAVVFFLWKKCVIEEKSVMHVHELRNIWNDCLENRFVAWENASKAEIFLCFFFNFFFFLLLIESIKGNSDMDEGHGSNMERVDDNGPTSGSQKRRPSKHYLSGTSALCWALFFIFHFLFGIFFFVFKKTKSRLMHLITR